MSHESLRDYVEQHLDGQCISSTLTMWSRATAQLLVDTNMGLRIWASGSGPQVLGLRFCDFGGSFIDGSRATVFPGVRYRLLSLVSRLGQAPLLSTVEEDLFALGSTIYFTVTGSAPYEEVADEDEVEKFFRECTFTDLVDVPCADIIALCWKQGAKSAQLVAEKIRRASPAGI